MRRLLPALLLLSSIATSAFSQDLGPLYTEAFRRPALDVALAPDLLWVADGFGISLATRSGDPKLVGSMALPGVTSLVTLQGDRAWVLSGQILYLVSWNGESFSIEGSIDPGEPVYDMVSAKGHLFLGTPSGVVRIDPTTPGSRSVLPTTSGSAVSLAVDGNTLVAADGDATAEIYSIDVPTLSQKIGTANLNITGAIRIHVVDGNLLVSNGRDSQLLGGVRPPFSSLSILNVGALSAAATTPGLVLVAGQDTTVRMLDLRLSQGLPSIVHEERIPPSEGSINRILRMRADQNHAWLAAGDLGLLTYDLVDFGTPFPLVRSFGNGADEIVDLGNGQIVVSGGNEPPQVYTIEASGAARQVAVWTEQTGVRVLDHIDEVAIVAQSGTIRLVRPSGAATGQFQFGAAVTSAVAIDGTIWATLGDRTLWKVAASGGTPERVDISGASPSFVARGEGRLIIGSFNDNGTTIIHEVDRANPAQSPAITFEGLASSGAAVGGGKVVAATFRGLSLLDVTGGFETLVPLGEGVVPRGLEIAGNEILVLAADRVQRRSLANGTLIESLPLLSTAHSISSDGANRAFVAASESLYTVHVGTPASPPQLVESPRASRYFEKIDASEGFVYLLEGNSVTSRVMQNGAVASAENVRMAMGDLIDIAATTFGFCALDSAGLVTCHDPAGRLVAAAEVPALDDATFLSVHSIGDAVLVSLLEGCLSQGCRKRTAIYEPASGSLVAKGGIEGEIVALEVDGNRVAVVTDLPDELRVYEIAGGGALNVISSRALDGDGFDVEISGNTVYVLGDRVRVYALPSLTEAGELLDPFVVGAGYAARDQRIEILGDRVVISGRPPGIRVYQIMGPLVWTLDQTTELAGPVREMVRSGSLLVLRTDYSLTVMGAPRDGTRRRLVR